MLIGMQLVKTFLEKIGSLRGLLGRRGEGGGSTKGHDEERSSRLPDDLDAENSHCEVRIKARCSKSLA
jgi:hypothetical protein